MTADADVELLQSVSVTADHTDRNRHNRHSEIYFIALPRQAQRSLMQRTRCRRNNTPPAPRRQRAALPIRNTATGPFNHRAKTGEIIDLETGIAGKISAAAGKARITQGRTAINPPACLRSQRIKHRPLVGCIKIRAAGGHHGVSRAAGMGSRGRACHCAALAGRRSQQTARQQRENP